MMTLEIKMDVIKKIALGRNVTPMKKAKWRIGSAVVHVRYRTDPKSDGETFAYNINPNTLTADFELWICGDANRYYLFPTDLMKSIYYDPEAYRDYTHRNIRVVDINTATHLILYGRGSKSLDGSDYFRANLGDSN